MSIIPIYNVDTVPLYDFGSDQAVDNATNGAATTWYGNEVDFTRELVGAKFFGETAQTGTAGTGYQIVVYGAAGTSCAYLNTAVSGTDHTANTHTDLTLTSDPGSSTRQNAAGVMYTVGVHVSGSPTMLHTNSKVVSQWAAASAI